MNRTVNKIKNTVTQMLVAVLIGAFVWVGFAVYQALTDIPTIVVEPGLLDPFTPNLDEEYLQKLSKRRQLSQELSEIVIAEPIMEGIEGEELVIEKEIEEVEVQLEEEE